MAGAYFLLANIQSASFYDQHRCLTGDAKDSWPDEYSSPDNDDPGHDRGSMWMNTMRWLTVLQQVSVIQSNSTKQCATPPISNSTLGSRFGDFHKEPTLVGFTHYFSRSGSCPLEQKMDAAPLNPVAKISKRTL